jgi:hypothetical protein
MRPETATTRALSPVSLPFVPALLAAALLAFAAAFFPPAAAHAQQQDAEAAVEQAARRAFHGDDLTGKDGPMGKASMELARIHERAVAATSPETSAATSAAPEMVIVDAVARENAEDLMNALETLGLENGAVAGPIVSGRLPATALEQAARREELRFLRRSHPVLLAGDALSQGVEAMNADDARANQNVDGSGVRVGVLSDSYNQDAAEETTAPEDQASNDLPDDVIVLDDSDASGTDEGRAMMQLTYDTAPGTVMAFHTANGGKANFANGICELAGSAGEDGICSGATGTTADASEVITDDFIYFSEPFFQDGVIAQAVDYVVDDDSVAYFSAAGNYADQSYESRDGFEDSGKNGPNGDPLHDFAPSSGVTDAYQQITVREGERMLISFQWEEPYASACEEGCRGASTDLDLFVYDADSSTVLASSQNDNDGSDATQFDSQDPIEVIEYTNNSGSSTLNLAISQKNDSEDGLLKYIIGGGGVPVDGAGEHDTGFSTLFGHANADSAEAVGAARYDRTPRFGESPPVIRFFSALGGTPIFYDKNGNDKSSAEVRRKPELVAPDLTNTTFFGTDISNSFPNEDDSNPNFAGTSAAAPHAAGVAALFREERPNSSAFTIYSELESSATGMDRRYTADRTATTQTICTNKFDFHSGCGLVNAEQAAIPVELAGDFDGVVDEKAVVLTWTTLSETENDRFRILQKQDGNDSFEQVGAESTQAAGGASSRPLDYQHRVEDVAPGAHTFRLVQVDTDGTAQQVAQTRVEVGLGGASYRLTATHPNPFRKRAEMRLTVRRAQHVTAALYDASGRRVRTLHDGPLPAGTPERLAVEADALSSGVYVLRVSGETFSATRTLTLVR